MVISVSTAETANIRHDRTGRPSTSTVQAPHTPCSQPTWVPVSPQVVAQRVGEQPARGHRDVVGAAVHDQAHGVQLARSCRTLPVPERASRRRAERSTRAVSTRTSCAR